MASLLLLYYRLALEGGFENGVINHVDITEFNLMEMLEVEVAEDCADYIDAYFLREGAAIFILCALHDMIAQYPKDFLSHELTQNIILQYRRGRFASVPESREIFKLLEKPEDKIDYDAYEKCLDDIFEQYVLRRFRALVPPPVPIDAIDNGDAPEE